jgi:CheY-like chemotaxis protein
VKPDLTLRVLILDDCRDGADSLGMLVRLWGYDPLVAYTSEAALELASLHRPHVALLDIALPHLTGFDVARCLRQRPELEMTVLVAVTGYGDEATRRRALGCGIESVLVKPADPEVLKQLLADVASHALVRTVPMAKKTQKLPIMKGAARPNAPVDGRGHDRSV